MVSYIQNEMQSALNSVLAVFQTQINEPNILLCGDYENLPVMQFILLERYKVAKERATALKEARNAGLPDNIALQMCGFDENIELKEVKNERQENNSNQNGTEGNQES